MTSRTAPWLPRRRSPWDWRSLVQAALVLVTAVCLSPVAQAQTCSLLGLNALPMSPTLRVASTLSAGQAVLSTRVSVTYSCSGSAGQAIALTPPIAAMDGAVPVNGASNLAVLTSSLANGTAALGGPSSANLTVSSGPCRAGLAANGNGTPYLSFNATGTCTGSATGGLTFVTIGAGQVTGALPTALTPSSTFSSFPAAWMLALLCNSPTCSGFAGTALATANLPTAVPIVTLASTCALVGTSARTVVLPPLSTSDFAGVGSVAGRTPVSIAVNCPMAGMSGLRFTLRYMPLASGAGVSPYLSNTAAVPASGVNVVFQDANLNYIYSEQPLTVTDSIAYGLNTVTFFAAYGQSTPSLRAGGVQGVATFEFTYF